jgi:hypothetical protein
VAAREAVAARLAEAGVTPLTQTDQSLMIHDLDGNAIELMVDAVEV